MEDSSTISGKALAVLLVVGLLTVACARATPAPPTEAAALAAATAAPPTETVAPIQAPTEAAPTEAAPTEAVAPTIAPTETLAPTAAAASPAVTSTAVAAATGGLPAADVEKLVNGKFNTVDRNLALWNIQPGLGTVMIEYGNRLARLWYAANANNWDMARYQLDEMTEIQEVGETTRPARADALKAFEQAYLQPLDAAISAKDAAKFRSAFDNTLKGCNACHQASSSSDWKSFQMVHIQAPKTDPAPYVDWKGGSQGNYVAAPESAVPTPQPPPTGTLDAGGVEALINGKFNTVDRNLALWNIQPGLGTVMIEYGDRLGRLWQAAHANNWDMAKYQLDEMTEIQEVGETTRPARADALKAFEHGLLDPLSKAIDAQQLPGFEDAFKNAVGGCNACHAAAQSANFKSYGFVKIQVPASDHLSYLVWKAPKLTGDYIPAPESAAPTARPPLSGPVDMAGAEKLVNDKFNTVDRSLALWNIQPGLGTVMMEYARRMAQTDFALKAGNWDMASYQVTEATEIQEVGETTRPARAPMLKAFEDSYLKPLDAALAARDKAQAEAALQKAISGCNACHAASTSANFKSYGFVAVQEPSNDPADYILWSVGAAGAGNRATPAATPAATAGPAAALPKGAATAGRAIFQQDCDACHPSGGKGMGPALSGSEFKEDFASDQAVADIIRHGKEAMPAFADRLTDQQIADVIAFIRTLK